MLGDEQVRHATQVLTYPVLDRAVLLAEDRRPLLDVELEDIAGRKPETESGAMQSASEQEGFLHHMREEHLTPEDVGKMAAKAGVKAVVVTHLSPTVIPNDDYQRYIDVAKKLYAGPITLAKDLMKF
jgi:hypothetical protein